MSKGGASGGKAAAAKTGAKAGLMSIIMGMARLGTRHSNESMMAGIGARLAQFGMALPAMLAKGGKNDAENMLRQLQTIAHHMEEIAARAGLTKSLRAEAKVTAAPKVAPQRRPAPAPQLTPKPPSWSNE